MTQPDADPAHRDVAPDDAEGLHARAYARLRYRLLLGDLALGLLVLLIAQCSGASVTLARWWAARLSSEPLVIAGYLAVFGSAYYLVMLPLHFYGSFRLEHRFGLSRMTLPAWWIREAKQVGISAVIGVCLVEGLYVLLRHTPTTWPLWATGGWVVCTVGLARVFPTVLLPLFYKTAPVSDAGLVTRLLELCARVGVRALGVFRVDLGVETRKANAALVGLGKSRRVLLSDTLLAEFSPDEIIGVLAHELAHHRYRHILKMLCLSAVGSWVAFSLTGHVSRSWVRAFSLTGLADVAGLPVLLLWLSLLGIIGLPIQNGIARAFEWQADRFAAAMVKPATVFASALRRLGQLNLADPSPPRWVVWWFFDHPPITERIQAAERNYQ